MCISALRSCQCLSDKLVVRIDFIKRLMFIELFVRGEGMTTFGQRVKKAWKNIDAMKPKNNDTNQKKDKK